MQHAGFLFLDRVWEKDQATIKNLIGYYKSCQSALSVRMIENSFYSIFSTKSTDIFNS